MRRGRRGKRGKRLSRKSFRRAIKKGKKRNRALNSYSVSRGGIRL